jgi:hypothetical protein
MLQNKVGHRLNQQIDCLARATAERNLALKRSNFTLFFPGVLQERYLSFCADFGPVNREFLAHLVPAAPWNPAPQHPHANQLRYRTTRPIGC